MIRVLPIAFICISFVSCNDGPKSGGGKTDQDSVQVSSLIIGDPLDCGIPNTLMFPIGTSYNPKVHGEKKAEEYNVNGDAEGNMTFSKNTISNYDRFAQEEYANNNQNDFDITNILFYDLETGDSYPLITDDTLHILSFAIHNEFENPLIFYRAVRNDFNDDEKFSALDPILLLVSPLAGDTMIQVTPNDEQFIDYFYYSDTQKILAKTRIDADHDEVYTASDETNFVELELNSPGYGKPLFDESLKNDLKGKLNL